MGVFKWGEEWLWETVGKEWVLIGGLVSTYSSVDMLGFPEYVCEEGGVVIGRGEVSEAAFAGGEVHAGVVRKLNSLDDVEDDGIFEPDQLEADLAEIQGIAGVEHVNCAIHT